MKVQAEDGGQVFPAHKIVLCLRSIYLCKVLLAHTGQSVVKIEGVAETEVLKEVRLPELLDDFRISGCRFYTGYTATNCVQLRLRQC